MALSTVASLIFRFGADTADFTTDVGRAAKQADKAARQIQEQLREVGTAAQLYIGEQLVQAFTWAADAARQAIGDFEDLAESAQKIGTSVESLSTLRYAAQQAGVEAGTLQAAMTRLSVKIAEAAGGSKQAANVFATMGVAFKDANGNARQTDEVFRDLATRFASYADGSQEAALAVQVFGRSGAELVPLLNMGAEGMARAEERARAMGQEISTGAAVAADTLSDNMTDLNLLVKGFVNDGLKAVLPGLAQLSTYLADAAIKSREAGKESNALASIISGAVNTWIVFKVAVQQVATVIAFAIDAMAQAVKNSWDLVKAFGAQFTVYKTLITEGPVAAFERMREVQENFIATAQNGPALIADKYALLKEMLNEISEEGFRQFDAFNNAASQTAEAIGDVGEEGKDAAPVIQDLATQTNAAAEAQREHNRALREAQRELKEAERDYAEYLKRQFATEDAAAKASEALTEYLEESDRWLRNISDAAADYEDTLLRLLETEQKLAAAGRLSADAQNDLAEARRRAAAIRDTRENEAAGLFGGGMNNLEEVLRRAVRAAFDERNLGSFFRKIRESFSNAFSRRSGEGVGAFIDRAGAAINQGLSFVNDAVQAWEAGGTTLERVANVAAMIPGPVGTIAQILQGINKLAGGKLFGTSWSRESGSREISIGAGGASGRDIQREVRQRSFFRGRQWRDVATELDADTRATIDQLFESIAKAVASTADLLGVEATSIVSGSFKQEFDKDGNLTKEFGTIMGQVFNESFEQFAARLQAENILGVIAEAFPTENIQQIADRWRDSGEGLLEGATTLLSLAAAMKDGTSIFTVSLADVITILDEVGQAGESLFDTYQRIMQSAMAYGQAVASVQEEMLTANLSQFSRAVLNARRQELSRIATLNQLAQTTGLSAAREQDLAAVRAATNAKIQVLIAELTQDARDLVRELYQSAPSTNTPIQELPDTINDAVDALASFRQSVQDFVKGLEIDENLSPFGAMQRLQRARAMLKEAAARGDLQSAQQLATATLNIGRDLYASGADYRQLFEEVQGIVSGVRAPATQPTRPTVPTIPTAPTIPEDVSNRVRLARELAQAVADIAAERDMSFEDVAAELGFSLTRLGADLGLSGDSLTSYLESLQADTVDLATVLEELPRNIARELAALLQGQILAPPPGSGTTPPPGGGTGPGGGGTGPGGGIGPGAGGGGDYWDQILPREPWMPDMRPREEIMMPFFEAQSAKLDVLITETRAGNISNEQALEPIREELTLQRYLLEDAATSERTTR